LQKIWRKISPQSQTKVFVLEVKFLCYCWRSVSNMFGCFVDFLLKNEYLLAHSCLWLSF